MIEMENFIMNLVCIVFSCMIDVILDLAYSLIDFIKE